jgi:hypothetical protein
LLIGGISVAAVYVTDHPVIAGIAVGCAAVLVAIVLELSFGKFMKGK